MKERLEKLAGVLKAMVMPHTVADYLVLRVHVEIGNMLFVFKDFGNGTISVLAQKKGAEEMTSFQFYHGTVDSLVDEIEHSFDSTILGQLKMQVIGMHIVASGECAA